MKILWAVDVLESHPTGINSMTRFLKSLNKRVPLKVDAVSVVYQAPSSPSGDLKRESLMLLKSRLGRATKEKWFESPHVLLESQIPQRAAVMDLVEFAQKRNYDAIVAIKHTKAGRKRAYLGSFAEMLAFLSPIPLFLINPDGVIPKDIRTMLYATDAGLECGQEFRKLSKFLPLGKALIRLHHQIKIDLPRLLSSQDLKFYRNLETKNATECLERVIELGHQFGSQIEIAIQREIRSPEDSILKEATKSKSDLIVLTHKGKGAFGFFLGRITRRVLQNADRPVLLFRA